MTHALVRRCAYAAIGAALMGAAALPVAAQQQEAAPQQSPLGPPIQQIATAAAVSTEPLGMMLSVRELPDGRILVDDAQRRRLLLMDSSLKVVGVVLDSLSDAENFYGVSTGAAGLLPFRGDTTLFIDAGSYAMLVIDPAGKVVRVRSIWRVQDMYSVVSRGSYGGWPDVDARGRIVYRISATAAAPTVRPPAGVPYIPNTPDSAFVVAADVDTRRLDTLGVVRIPKTEYRVYQTPGQTGFSIISAFNPLPRYDGWAVLADGTVAFVRGVDYRVEYLEPDGSIRSSPKLPYEWQRLTSEDKQRLVDSVRTARRRTAALNQVADLIRWVNSYKKQYPAEFKVPQGFVLPPGLPKDARLPPGVSFPENYIYACPPGVEPTMVAGPAAAAAGAAAAAAVEGVTPPAGAQVMVRREAAGAPGQPAQVAVSPPAGAQAPSQAAPGALPGAMTVTPSCFPNFMMIGAGREPPPPTIREPAIVKPDELPDFRPPMPNNAVRADREGNLWIRTNPPRPTPGDGIVYDIVNRQGELTTRLQTPPGYTIVGFGRNKVVFLSMRDATGMHLARVRLR